MATSMLLEVSAAHCPAAETNRSITVATYYFGNYHPGDLLLPFGLLGAVKIIIADTTTQ